MDDEAADEMVTVKPDNPLTRFLEELRARRDAYLPGSAVGEPPVGRPDICDLLDAIPVAKNRVARADALMRLAVEIQDRGVNDFVVDGIRDALDEAGLCSKRTFDRQLSKIRKAKSPERRQRKSPAPGAEQFHLTDVGNGERLAARHAYSLRYVPSWGWLVWSGTHWEQNEGEANRRAKETVRSIYGEAALATDDTRTKIAEWALQSESALRIKALLDRAKSEEALEERPESFDADPMLFNCANGTVDLWTGKLRLHNPGDLLTKQSGVHYDPDAICPRWESFLERVMDGNTRVMEFAQRCAGYSLTGNTDEQCLFSCYGTGANGKSVFLETIRAAMGNYAKATPFETLLVKPSGSGGATPDIARMAGARFITAIEAGEGRRLDEALIKVLTGGDTIPARHLYQKHFEFRPQFKLWLASNHKLAIKDNTESLWRRMRLIPFTVTIPEGERDPKLAAKLRAELPGILAWAVRGCLEWQAAGLGTPDEVTAATERYRAEQDTLAAFFGECCVLKPEAEALAGKLLEAFKAWTGDHIDAKDFRQKLLERGFTPQHTKRGNIWRGIGLIDLLSDEG